ncbi:MAG: hypothetical protein ACI4II_01085 [Acutalibacteraceae bacterium]
MMKLGLFRYATSFKCNSTVEEATKRIFEAALCEDNNLEVVRACYDGAQKITLNSSTGSYIYHNSFMPIVNIDIEESDGVSLIHILFELKQRTKMFMMLFSMMRWY